MPNAWRLTLDVNNPIPIITNIRMYRSRVFLATRLVSELDSILMNLIVSWVDFPFLSEPFSPLDPSNQEGVSVWSVSSAFTTD